MNCPLSNMMGPAGKAAPCKPSCAFWITSEENCAVVIACLSLADIRRQWVNPPIEILSVPSPQLVMEDPEKKDGDQDEA